jgi:hypothetical protein
MTDEQIAEISARVEAATPGPWEECRPNVYAYLGGSDVVLVGTFKFGSGDEADADRALTVNARKDLAALLADNERLRRQADFWENAAQKNGELYAAAENQRDEARSRIAELEKDSAALAALEAHGVDNWEGYSDALAGVDA